MSGSLGQAAPTAGVLPGGNIPGGAPANVPGPRLPGPSGTPGGGGAVRPLGNALAPMGPQAAPPPGGPPPPAAGGMPSSIDEVSNILSKSHGQAKAAYDNTTKALGQLDAIRKGLERLSDKGDMVMMEDVIEEAGKLVGHGVDPVALAGLLADAPQEGAGEALGGWVATHAITAATAEQQLLAAHNAARHEMGVSALRLIMAHTVGQAVLPTPQEQLATENQLTPGHDAPPPTNDSSSMMAMGRRFMPGAPQ